MPVRYVPDGSGGFLRTVVPSGMEVTGTILLLLGAALMAPFLVGMLVSFVIVGIMMAILSLPASVGTTTVLYVLVSGLYLVFFGMIYLHSFPKMVFWEKIIWGIAIISIACTPLMALFYTFGGEVTGVNTSAVVSKAQENYQAVHENNSSQRDGISETYCYYHSTYNASCNPGSNQIQWTRYKITNPGQKRISVYTAYDSKSAMCFGDGDTKKFYLYPGESKYFFCASRVTANGETIFPEQSISISNYDFGDAGFNSSYKNLSANKNWK